MSRRPLGQLDLGMIDRFRLGWRLLRDPRVPAWPKWSIPAFAVIYALSPVDAIPDFIPFLGQLDDISVIAVALAIITLLVRWSPQDLVAEHAADLGIGIGTGTGREAGEHSTERRQRQQEPIEATYWVDDWR